MTFHNNKLFHVKSMSPPFAFVGPVSAHEKSVSPRVPQGEDHASRRLVHEHAPLSLRPLLAERAAEHERGRGVPGAVRHLGAATSKTQRAARISPCVTPPPTPGERVAPRTGRTRGDAALRRLEALDRAASIALLTTHVSPYQTVVPFPAGQNWARE